MERSEVFNSLFGLLSDEDIARAEYNSSVSSKILARRKMLGMTQGELASALGVTKSKLSKWESCSYNFSTSEAERIYEELDLISRCPFCNSIVVRVSKNGNGFCRCSAKYYGEDRIWLHRKTGKTIKI